MKIQNQIVIILLLLLPILSFSQNQIPLISGKASFSVEKGTIECDLTLSEYSHIEDYVIRLNSGLNILNIQSLEPHNFMVGYRRSLKESVQTDETNAYYLPANNGGKFLPKKLRFKYVGKFPVITDTLSTNHQRYDWRGNIAFNNHILRVDGAQSAWYPVLYDVENEYDFTDIRYDIEIACIDCEKIYVNGNEPVVGKKAYFKSDVPREMYIFLGKYAIQKTKGVTLLNTDFSKDELKEFSRLNMQILDFLKDYTNISYKEQIYWVQGNITSIENAWSFVSFPTFTSCGYPPYDLKSTFVKDYKSASIYTTSHELSHYYFGTLKRYNNTLEMLFNEGFAEFLAIKYLQSKSEGYQKFAGRILEDKLEYINDEEFELKAMGELQEVSETNDRETYAYDYQTLVLLSIEKEIGAVKMKHWIQNLLKEDKAVSDFDFFKKTLKEAIKDDKKYSEVLTKYLSGSDTIKNINTIFKK